MPFNFVVAAAGVTDLETSGCVIDGVPTIKCFEILFSNILFLSSAFVILIIFIMFIIGGFTYLTSFGNPEKVKSAQGTLRYAVVGAVVYMSAFLIIKIVDVVFLGNQGTLFRFNLGELPTPIP